MPHDDKKKDTTTQVEVISGLGAAIVTIGTTYPITKLIYRQILENRKASKSLRNIVNEGPKGLYRGVLPPMLQRCLSLSTMFGMYRAAVHPLERFHMNEYVETICACAISGTFESFFMPLERVQMLLVASEYNQRFRNMFHLVSVITKEYTIREFYRGYNTILFRNIASNSCFFLTRNLIHKHFEISETPFKRNLQHFFYGSLIGTFMTLLFYPLKVLKTNMHQQLGGRFRSGFEVAKEVYYRDGGGINNFYRGVILNSLRSLFSWGITNATYEYIRKLIS